MASLYPTFTYGDDPTMWIGKNEEAKRSLRESTDEYRKNNWLMMEKAAGAPYFLGSQKSAIDIYLFVMSHWRPGAKWFQENCPKIGEINAKIESDPTLAEVWRLNFS